MCDWVQRITQCPQCKRELNVGQPVRTAVCAAVRRRQKCTKANNTRDVTYDNCQKCLEEIDLRKRNNYDWS